MSALKAHSPPKTLSKTLSNYQLRSNVPLKLIQNKLPIKRLLSPKKPKPIHLKNLKSPRMPTLASPNQVRAIRIDSNLRPQAISHGHTSFDMSRPVKTEESQPVNRFVLPSNPIPTERLHTRSNMNSRSPPPHPKRQYVKTTNTTPSITANTSPQHRRNITNYPDGIPSYQKPTISFLRLSSEDKFIASDSLKNFNLSQPEVSSSLFLGSSSIVMHSSEEAFLVVGKKSIMSPLKRTSTRSIASRKSTRSLTKSIFGRESITNNPSTLKNDSCSIINDENACRISPSKPILIGSCQNVDEDADKIHKITQEAPEDHCKTQNQEVLKSIIIPLESHDTSALSLTYRNRQESERETPRLHHSNKYKGALLDLTGHQFSLPHEEIFTQRFQKSTRALTEIGSLSNREKYTEEDSEQPSDLHKNTYTSKFGSTKSLFRDTSKDIFSSESGAFFTLNKNSELLAKIGSIHEGRLPGLRKYGRQTSNIADYHSSRGQESLMTIDSKPVAIVVAKKKTIIQPEYMKKVGSMCFTELWPERTNKQVLQKMKEDAPDGQIVHIKSKQRRFETLYKPDKWQYEDQVGKRLVAAQCAWGDSIATVNTTGALLLRSPQNTPKKASNGLTPKNQETSQDIKSLMSFRSTDDSRRVYIKPSRSRQNQNPSFGERMQELIKYRKMQSLQPDIPLNSSRDFLVEGDL